MLAFKELLQTEIRLDSPQPIAQSQGKIVAINANLIMALIPQVAIGDYCKIFKRDSSYILAQVISFKDQYVHLAAFEELRGVMPGCEIVSLGERLNIPAAAINPGSVVNALGEQIVERAQGPRSIEDNLTIDIEAQSPEPFNRSVINQILSTGVSAIDSACTIGYGQRIGLFAGPGVGKSTLLGMIARNADVDLCVIALVGERGREVQEFIEHVLGNQGLSRSILVVTTSDQSSMLRSMAAKTATAIAEFHRNQGKRVLLMIDSLTRVARAVRDLSLAAGELPVRQGYTPSVYEMLPKLLERAGNTKQGSITAIYTVLTQSSEEQDALGEEVKSLLDGHLVLNQRIALLGIRPALDVNRSISRLADGLLNDLEKQLVNKLRRYLARLENDRDIVMLGGSPDPELASIILNEGKLVDFLKQAVLECRSKEYTFKLLEELILLIDRSSSS